MPDHAERKPEDTEDVSEETTENKPLGLIQYPAEPGKTQYGTYQNPHK
ncbi:MAG: hypothetical protein WAM92_11480 [Mycobacterium sp.]